MTAHHNRHRMQMISQKLVACATYCRAISLFMRLSLVLAILFSCERTYAQVTMDTTGLKMIDIKGDSLKGMNDGSINYQRVIGNVVIAHDGTTMTCDSAHFYLEENMVEAFSQVSISKENGTNAHCDYIRYTGANTTALMQGNVQILDGKNTLYTEELTYNVKTKIGKYFQGGTLQTEETTVSSNEGTYNGFTKQTLFVKDVIITNPKYTIESQELTYNTDNKVIKFLAKSTIIGENTTVYTTGGTYDSKNEKAFFNTRTTVENDEQIITGNTLQYNDKNGDGKATGNVVIVDKKNNSKIMANVAEYNRVSGYGKATGKVIIEQEGGKNILTAEETVYNKKSGYAKASGSVILVDTAEKTSLRCGVMEFNEHSKFMLASVQPKLLILKEKDSTYIRADTMMSIRVADEKKLERTEIVIKEKKNKTKFMSYNLLYADSTWRSDAKEEPKLIIANHTVRIFADSMQAVCDSLRYSQADSTFFLFKQPVMWSNAQQSSGDTVVLITRESKLSEVRILHNAFIVSETGYVPLYDQVSGNYITAMFANNAIDKVYVDQNAESIYYAKDDEGAFLGLNKAESAKMNVYFKDKKLDHIVMLENPKGVFYPIDQISDSEKFLSGFKLYSERRPKSKEEILDE